MAGTYPATHLASAGQNEADRFASARAAALCLGLRQQLLQPRHLEPCRLTRSRLDVDHDLRFPAHAAHETDRDPRVAEVEDEALEVLAGQDLPGEPPPSLVTARGRWARPDVPICESKRRAVSQTA